MEVTNIYHLGITIVIKGNRAAHQVEEKRL